MFFNKELKFSCAAVTNVGKVRKNNEDNFYFDGVTVSEEAINSMTDESIVHSSENGAKGGLYCVCDGMGGESYGEVASQIAVSTLCEFGEKFAQTDRGKLKDIITQYAELANERICEKITEFGVNRIGTTYALLSFIGSTAYISNIGDSRVYHIRSGNIKQLTRDHTEIAYYIAAGIITAEEAKNHPRRHGLTQHLGMFPDDMKISPYFTQVVEAKAKDIFILCSDGLTDMLDDEKICQIAVSASKKGAETVVKNLLQEALAAGGRDNVTIIAVCVK